MHEVWRVVCLPGPVAAVRVATVQQAADGTIVLVTEMPHSFSGAKQLATLAGLPGELDGHYAIWASDRRKSRHELSIKMRQLDEGTWQAVQQAVAAGGVHVRWVAVQGWRLAGWLGNCTTCLQTSTAVSAGGQNWLHTAACPVMCMQEGAATAAQLQQAR